MQTIDTLTDTEFQAFYKWLPARTQLLVKSGYTQYNSPIIQEWLEKYLSELSMPNPKCHLSICKNLVTKKEDTYCEVCLQDIPF